MSKIEEQVTIGAPAEDVFACLADVERLIEWFPGVVSARRTSRKRTGVGVTAEVTARAAGREVTGTGRCVEWDAPRRLVLMASLDNGVTATSAFDCAGNGRVTELKARIEYTLPGSSLSRWVGGFVGDALGKRELKKALESLKRQIEAADD